MKNITKILGIVFVVNFVATLSICGINAINWIAYGKHIVDNLNPIFVYSLIFLMFASLLAFIFSDSRDARKNESRF